MCYHQKWTWSCGHVAWCWKWDVNIVQNPLLHPRRPKYPYGRGCGNEATKATLETPQERHLQHDCCVYCCVKSLWECQVAVLQAEVEAGLPVEKQGIDYVFKDSDLCCSDDEKAAKGGAVVGARKWREQIRQIHIDRCFPEFQRGNGYIRVLRNTNVGNAASYLPPSGVLDIALLGKMIPVDPDRVLRSSLNAFGQAVPTSP